MPTPARQAKLDRMYANRLPGVLVVLEDITDPHNAAAILRTCDGLGVGTVWYLFAQTDPYEPRSIGKRSSATANQWIDIETFTDRATLEQRLHNAGFMSVASTIHEPSAVSVWESDWRSSRIALWVGNEHRGLSDAALDFCERAVTIPMRGMVESLNVSVATAVILAEITRQRCMS